MPKKSPEATYGPAESEALGRRIDTIAKAAGTRSKAADLMGISTQALGNLIKGRSAPSAISLARLCVETGYSLDWVVTGEGLQKRNDPRLASAAQDEKAAEVYVGAEIMGKRLLDLVNYLTRALEASYGPTLSEDEFDEVLAAAIDVVAPDQKAEADWQEVAERVAKSHAGIGLVLRRRLRAAGT